MNYYEALSTLRFANRAKANKNDAKFNGSAHENLITNKKKKIKG